MITFLALYRGPSLSGAKVVGVSSRSDLLAHVADVMLSDNPHEMDAALAALTAGRGRALELIHRESLGETAPAPDTGFLRVGTS